VLSGSRQELLFKLIKPELVKEGRFTQEEFLSFSIYPEKIDHLNNLELCWFILAIEKCSLPGERLCKAVDYFEPPEINDAKLYYREFPDIDNFLSLEYCGTLAQGQYLCKATVEQIGRLRMYGYLQVVPEAQRQSTKIMVGNEILNKIHVNYNRVNKIAELISKNKYYYNDIRFNLVNDGESEFIINEDKGTLILPKDGSVIIPDGNHRSIACEVAITDYEDKKDIFSNNKFPILFTHYPVIVVKEIVSQEWNREPIPKRHEKSMKSSNGSKIVDLIILKAGEDADERYAGQIVTTKDEISRGNGVILKDMLIDAISTIYNTETANYDSPIARSNLSKWLIEFSNQVVYILGDDYSNIEKTKKTKWSASSEAWCGFVALSFYLQNDKDWALKLVQILNNVDFDKSKIPTKSNYNAKTIKDMSMFFKEMIPNE